LPPAAAAAVVTDTLLTQHLASELWLIQNQQHCCQLYCLGGTILV
jgi:hypothetical protein